MDPEADPTARPSPTANRVRDHLANERTFLAWVRTALGLIGLGFVLARMGLFLRQLALAEGAPHAHGLRTVREFMLTGIVILMLGIALCGWAGWHYERNRRFINAEIFEPARRSPLVLAGLIITGGIVIVGLMIGHTLGPP